jgi:TonB family protein
MYLPSQAPDEPGLVRQSVRRACSGAKLIATELLAFAGCPQTIGVFVTPEDGPPRQADHPTRASLMPPMLLRALAPLALILLHTHSVEAQRRGGFRVSGSGYGTTARLLPDNGDPAGELTWYCGSTEGVDVRLGPEGDRRPLVSYVVWRFDELKADTAFLIRSALRRGDRLHFSSRAASAARLTIRLLGTDPGQPGVEYSYGLPSAGRVLSRLSCASGLDAPPGERRADWPPPEGLVPNPPDSISRGTIKNAAGAGVELSEVEEVPVVINAAEMLRQLSRLFPVTLRDAGATGDVMARFLVLEDGRVDPASITIRSAPDERFRSSLLELLPVLHFRPARVKGRPVKVWVEQPILFAVQS